MTPWTWIVLLQAAVVSGATSPANTAHPATTAKSAVTAKTAAAQPYDKALKESVKTGRPLLVLVAAQWCPACRRMKSTILPQVSRRGALRQVAFVAVDKDRQEKLAAQLMSGGTVPQLILFTKTSTGWKRRQLTGLHTVGEVNSFVHRTVAQTAAKPRRRVPR